MLRFYHFIFALCSFVFFTRLTIHESDKQKTQRIIEDMIEKVENLKTAHFSMSYKERFHGAYISSQSEVYIQFTPRKIYLRVIKGNGEKGPELLYKHGENNNNALISPNKFPYFNISLNPRGSFLRKNRHHTILQAGGKYMISILKSSYKKAIKRNFQKFFKYKGEKDFLGIPCYVIHVDNPNFRYFNYQVKPNESLKDVANKFHVSEYKIVESNSSIEDYDSDISASNIKIPNSYSSHLILYIDKKNHLPLYQEIYDDKGLLSQYSYQFFEADLNLSMDVFNEENPSYGF